MEKRQLVQNLFPLIIYWKDAKLNIWYLVQFLKGRNENHNFKLISDGLVLDTINNPNSDEVAKGI